MMGGDLGFMQRLNIMRDCRSKLGYLDWDVIDDECIEAHRVRVGLPYEGRLYSDAMLKLATAIPYVGEVR